MSLSYLDYMLRDKLTSVKFNGYWRISTDVYLYYNCHLNTSHRLSFWKDIDLNSATYWVVDYIGEKIFPVNNLEDFINVLKLEEDNYGQF